MSRYLAVFAMAWALIAVSGGALGAGQEPRYGGVLNAMQREELPVGFAVHESTTISTIWPAMPCFTPHNSNHSFGRMQNVWLDR